MQADGAFNSVRFENTSPDSSASHMTCLVNEDTCTHDKRKQTRDMPDEQMMESIALAAAADIDKARMAWLSQSGSS